MPRFDEAIPPGGTGKVVLQVDTSGFQGRIHKSAVVTTDDPDRPSCTLAVKGEVRPDILIEPSRQVIFRGVVGERLQQVLRIRRPDGQPLELSQMQSNLEPWLRWQLRPGADGSGYNLQLWFQSEQEISPSGYLRFHTNHPRHREVSVPIFVRLRPEVEVWPRLVDFGRVKGGATGGRLKRVVALVDNRGEQVRLIAASSRRGYFQVESEPKAGSKRQRFRLDLIVNPQALPPGVLDDTLIIETDRGGFQVPVHIISE